MKHSSPGLYDRLFAAVYDPLMARAERETLSPLRSRLLAGARGTVLDIGAGTGSNLPFLDLPDTRAVFLDRSASMLSKALGKGLGKQGYPVIGSATALPFPDECFDSIVVTLVLCSVDDLSASLGEIHRTLRKEGSLFLMEHVLSDSPSRAAIQKLATPLWKRLAAGCHLDRPTDHLVRILFREEESWKEVHGILPFHVGRYKKRNQGTLLSENPDSGA
ncbi:MAG: class I SAM-dependent methyltransferase [Nitrospirae bacterium]|nr:class I SAM-dependent methyltransferase [Nitrospirota bacterium]MCL5285884.1 class I SAM-dependent methyltransferase [Nitrospirota bacterium]